MILHKLAAILLACSACWAEGYTLQRGHHVPFGSINTTLTQGLVGAWSPSAQGAGGDKLVDFSGISPAADLTGSMTWATSTTGPTLDYPAHAASYVSLNCDSSGPVNVAGPFTWTAWIYPQGNPQNSIGRIWTFRGANKEGHIIDDGTLEAVVYIGGSVRSPTSTAAVADNTWGHVCLVYDGASLYWVVDGEAQTSGAVSCSGAVYTGDFVSQLGANAGINYGFNGYIDSVLIYDRALAPSEIQDLYADPDIWRRPSSNLLDMAYTSGGAPPTTYTQVIMISMTLGIFGLAAAMKSKKRTH